MGPVGASVLDVARIGELPDDDVLRLADSRMRPADDRRFSFLLDQQQAGMLTNDQRSELEALVQLYQDGMLRKATGLREAVRRGFRQPEEA